jgi:hypothetical protein
VVERLASSLPGCPIKALIGLPCLTCGTTRAGLALSRLDLVGAISINPLAALAWLILVGGGLVAGLLALLDIPVREPEWRLSLPMRCLLVMAFLTNWAYLVGAGT